MCVRVCVCHLRKELHYLSVCSDFFPEAEKQLHVSK